MNQYSRSGGGVPSVEGIRQMFSSYLRSAHEIEAQRHWLCDGEKIFIGKIHSFDGMQRILRFLSDHPALRVAWIEKTFSIFPKGFEERGVSLNRILFCEAGSEGVWTLMEIIQSGLFPVIVCDASALVSKGSLWSQEKQWRRVQVVAQKTQCAVLIWRESYEKSKTSRVVHLHSGASEQRGRRAQGEKTA